MGGPDETGFARDAGVGGEGGMPGGLADERGRFGEQPQQRRVGGRIAQAHRDRAGRVDQPGGLGTGAGGLAPGDGGRERRGGFQGQRTGLAFEPGGGAGPFGEPVFPARGQGGGRGEQGGLFGGEDQVMRETVVALRVVKAAGDEAGEHEPMAVAGLERAEGERLAFRQFMRCADGFQQLREAVRDGAMARDGAIARTSRGEALRCGSEDELEGHQEVGVAGNIAGEERCSSQ